MPRAECEVQKPGWGGRKPPRHEVELLRRRARVRGQLHPPPRKKRGGGRRRRAQAAAARQVRRGGGGAKAAARATTPWRTMTR